MGGHATEKSSPHRRDFGLRPCLAVWLSPREARPSRGELILFCRELPFLYPPDKGGVPFDQESRGFTRKRPSRYRRYPPTRIFRATPLRPGSGAHLPALAVTAFSPEPSRIRREEGVPVRSGGAENKTNTDTKHPGNAAKTPRPEYLKNRGLHT